jgi:hypothetical protein
MVLRTDQTPARMWVIHTKKWPDLFSAPTLNTGNGGRHARPEHDVPA